MGFTLDEKSTKLFMYLLKSMSLEPESKETIFSVTISGEVILYAINNIINTSTTVNNPDKLDIERHNMITGFQSHNVDDIVVTNCNTQVVCIGCFTPIKDSRKIKFQINEKDRIFIVSGLIYKNLPSIGVYKFSQASFDMIYCESYIGSTSIAYNGLFGSLQILPRSLNGTMVQLPLFSSYDSTHKHDPNYIHRASLYGYGLKRTTEMSCSSKGPFHTVSWSNTECPYIVLWSSQLSSYSTLSIEFQEPLMIYSVDFNENGDHIGFCMCDHQKVYICVWHIDKGEISRQYNYSIDNFFKVHRTGWIKNFTYNKYVYCVWTSRGLIEYPFFIENSKPILNETSYRSRLFVENGQKSFFFDSNGILRIAGPNSLKIVQESIGEPKQSFSFLKIVTDGKPYEICGYHMPRCSNCRLPLSFPLVSKNEIHQTYYCSPECQKDHWPVYVTCRQPLFFEKQ